MVNPNFSEISLLKEWYVRDLQKPDIDKWDRAIIISSYMEDKGLSQRQFGKLFGIPHATVADWVQLAEVDRKEWDKALAAGHTPSALYRNLRKNRGVVAKSFFEVDLFCDETRRKVRQLVQNKELSVGPKTTLAVQDLINELNILLMTIERGGKKK